MSMKIMCQCGAELTIKKFKGPREDIPVVEQCEGCTVQAYHVGWVGGDAATTEETDYDAVLALMARESV